MPHVWYIYLLCSGLAAVLINEGAHLLGVPYTYGRLYDLLSLWAIAFTLQLVPATRLLPWWRRQRQPKEAS